MKRISAFCGLLAAVGLMFVSSLSAKAYTLSYTGLNLGQNVTIKVNGVQKAGFAGQIGWQFTGSAGTPTGYSNSFYAYCCSLENNLQTPMDVNIRSTNDLTRNNNSPNTGVKAAWLFNTYANQVNSNTTAAALQVAIWESLYDTSYSMSAGYFQLVTSDSALTNQVNTYLNALNSNFTATTATWFQPTNPSNAQDMLGAAAVSTVPEPGTMSLLACSGLSGLCVLRRRIR